MKKSNFLRLLAVSFIFLSGCESLSNGKESLTEINSADSAELNELNDKVSIIAGIDENDVYQYADIKVNSVSVMTEKIEGLNTEPFKFLPDKYSVADDGEILCDYSFIAVNISLYSDIDTEICLFGFKLESDTDIAGCYYNSNPTDSENAKESGYTKVAAGTENKVTIGFFADDEFLKSTSFALIPTALDTGEEQPRIIIDNEN